MARRWKVSSKALSLFSCVNGADRKDEKKSGWCQKASWAHAFQKDQDVDQKEVLKLRLWERFHYMWFIRHVLPWKLVFFFIYRLRKEEWCVVMRVVQVQKSHRVTCMWTDLILCSESLNKKMGNSALVKIPKQDENFCIWRKEQKSSMI